MKCIKKWSEDAELSLQACLESTDWSVFYESTNTGYMCFCEDTVVPSKTAKIYPHNKPRFNNTKKKLLEKNRLVSSSNNGILIKEVQPDIDKLIEASKNEVKHKIDNQFQIIITRDTWKELELVTQYKPKSPSLSVHELNAFYQRFDTSYNSV